MYRLPEHVYPKHYKLTINPSLRSSEFTGVVEIQLVIKQSVPCIYINVCDLVFTKIVLCTPDQSQTWIGAAEVATEFVEETAKLTFTDVPTILPGEYILLIEYGGQVAMSGNKGFYRCHDPRFPCSEDTEDYIKDSVLTTTFEPIFARSAFPCFDEPDKKAVFQLNILVPEKGMTAISNMPVAHITETPKGSLYQFIESPYMSTYLLVWVIGVFDYLETTSKAGVNVRVYTPRGRKEEAKFALDIAADCLDFYSEYFGIPYPLHKLDLIAVHKMHVRAMENWGCINFAEYVLLPKATDSLDTIHRSARTICHEISHMWFGNLVTMKWWTDIWLNEGFARYMEHIAVDKLKPNYKIWEKFYPQVLADAFAADRFPSTHPVEVECGKASEITKIFDTISYAKGASVIKMLNDYLGEAEFKKSVCTYLKAYIYSNTETKDLWKVFDQVTGKPISELMEKWTKLPGHPVVFVSEMPDKENCVILRQAVHSVHPGVTCSQIWPIPVKLLTEDGLKTILFDKEEISVEYKGFLKLNVGHHGFYRVKYSPTMFSKLVQNISSFSPIDRYGIMSDLFSSCGVDENFVKCMEGVKGEDSYIVWEIMSRGINRLIQKLHGNQREEQFKAILNKLFTESFEKVGRFDASDKTNIECVTQKYIAGILGKFAENPVVLKEAVKKLKENITTNFAEVSPEIASLIRDLACTSSLECVNLLDETLWKNYDPASREHMRRLATIHCKDLDEATVLITVKELDPYAGFEGEIPEAFISNCLKVAMWYLADKKMKALEESKIVMLLLTAPEELLCKYKEHIERLFDMVVTGAAGEGLLKEVAELHEKANCANTFQETPLTKAIDQLYLKLVQ